MINVSVITPIILTNVYFLENYLFMTNVAFVYIQAYDTKNHTNPHRYGTYVTDSAHIISEGRSDCLSQGGKQTRYSIFYQQILFLSGWLVD